MADIDVSALSLTTPPSLATVTAYRPAVLVKNNGIAAATASGELRIYNPTTGLLLYSTTLAPVSIPVGASRNVYGATYWTPPAVGSYLVTAQVTCPGDQVPANGILAPTTIIVSAEPPPPPPTVPEHASQHENGGEDELSLDGLSGELSEPQKAKDHAENHEVGGSDELNVTGLSGFLADAQPIGLHAATHAEGGIDPVTGVIPTIHHESHESGGSDEITGIGAQPHKTTHELHGNDQLSVAGLDGVLLRPQIPAQHSSSHGVAGTDPVNVGGLQGVLANAQLPQAHHSSHEPGGSDIVAALAPFNPLFSGPTATSTIIVSTGGGATLLAYYSTEVTGIRHIGAATTVSAQFSVNPGQNIDLELFLTASWTGGGGTGSSNVRLQYKAGSEPMDKTFPISIMSGLNVPAGSVLTVIALRAKNYGSQDVTILPGPFMPFYLFDELPG